MAVDVAVEAVIDRGPAEVSAYVHRPAATGIFYLCLFSKLCDVVYDSIGRTLADSLALARTGGSVVFFGMAAGDPDPVDPRLLMDRSLTLTGGDLWNVLTTADARQQRADRLFAAVRAGHLAVSIAARFALRDGAQAHALLESRGSAGKVLLVP